MNIKKELDEIKYNLWERIFIGIVGTIIVVILLLVQKSNAQVADTPPDLSSSTMAMQAILDSPALTSGEYEDTQADLNTRIDILEGKLNSILKYVQVCHSQ